MNRLATAGRYLFSFLNFSKNFICSLHLFRFVVLLFSFYHNFESMAIESSANFQSFGYTGLAVKKVYLGSFIDEDAQVNDHPKGLPQLDEKRKPRRNGAYDKRAVSHTIPPFLLYHSGYSNRI